MRSRCSCAGAPAGPALAGRGGAAGLVHDVARACRAGASGAESTVPDRRGAAGPGGEPVRSPSRINGVLTAVRGMVVHAVAAGQAPAGLVPLLYEVADDRDLPEQARGEDGRMSWRMRARHRLHEPETAVERASDEEIVALLGACRSARDRLMVLLMARAGLRRGELCGLRRSDVHSGRTPARWAARSPGASACRAPRGQPERGVGQVPPATGGAAGLPDVGAFDTYEFERMGCRTRAAISWWSTCSARRSARRCARTRSGSCSRRGRGGPG